MSAGGGGGPLTGVRVVEMAGIGPCPFAAMLLADLGADVARVDRLGMQPGGDPSKDVLNRGRRSVAVDAKRRAGAEVVLRMVEQADILLEGFRPGVMERLGLGPDVCMRRRPQLVYGRMTGWGQDGPLSHAAGHDINYIAAAGVLAHVGREGSRPVPPLNLVGDFGGGGMLLAIGVLAALVEARTSGTGQVVDAAMVDGAALLMSMIHGFSAMGLWDGATGTNILDTGAPFYEVYETADGGFVAVGAVEPQFYAELLRLAGLPDDDPASRMDRSRWPTLKEQFAAVFRTRSRAEWCELLEGTDACVAPVLTMAEAPRHPHLAHRGTFVAYDGVVQPAPAPRFSRTPGAIAGPPALPGAASGEVLAAWGFSPREIDTLASDGIVPPA